MRAGRDGVGDVGDEGAINAIGITFVPLVVVLAASLKGLFISWVGEWPSRLMTEFPL